MAHRSGNHRRTVSYDSDDDDVAIPTTSTSSPVPKSEPTVQPTKSQKSKKQKTPLPVDHRYECYLGTTPRRLPSGHIYLGNKRVYVHSTDLDGKKIDVGTGIGFIKVRGIQKHNVKVNSVSQSKYGVHIFVAEEAFARHTGETLVRMVKKVRHSTKATKTTTKTKATKTKATKTKATKTKATKTAKTTERKAGQPKAYLVPRTGTTDATVKKSAPDGSTLIDGKTGIVHVRESGVWKRVDLTGDLRQILKLMNNEVSGMSGAIASVSTAVDATNHAVAQQRIKCDIVEASAKQNSVSIDSLQIQMDTVMMSASADSVTSDEVDARIGEVKAEIDVNFETVNMVMDDFIAHYNATLEKLNVFQPGQHTPFDIATAIGDADNTQFV